MKDLWKSCSCEDWGRFMVRLSLAMVFLVHGWQKLMGLDMVVGFFGQLGLPAWLAGVVAVIEVLGGLAVLLGVYTKWAGYALALVMLGAVFTAHAGQPWSGKEFAVMLFVLSLGVAWIAPGKIAVPLPEGKGKK
jgi:uncharacterized membrane protein YphA (DoxX/SURF4 family)